MTLGIILLMIFFIEIFLELNPRILECKICQVLSLFINLGLFVQDCSDFCFPRLVLYLFDPNTGTDEHLELDTSTGMAVGVVDAESTGFHLDLFG